MLPPEVLRVVLLIGLAATGYMLIQAWNNDYVQQAPQVSYSEAPTLDNAAIAAPQVAPAQATAESDFPDASAFRDAAGSSDTDTAVAPATTAEDRLVTVFTPKLKLWIDRSGGDIIRVQLPEHAIELDRTDVPYQLLEQGGGHLYIAQSGLGGADGVDTGATRPLYSSNKQNLVIAEGETGDLVLTSRVGDLTVEKRFTFRADDYLVDMSYEVANGGSESVSMGLFAQIKRDAKEPLISNSFSLGPQSYLGGAITTAEERYLKVEFDDLDEGQVVHDVTGGWVAFLQHYFMSAWIADPAEANRFISKKRSDGYYVFGYASPAKTIAPGATQSWQAGFFAGPKDQHRLEQISPNLNLTVDYGFLWWLAVPLFEILFWCYGLVGNWGVAIILLTFAVKLVLYPLSAASYKSMAKMRKVAPQMKRLQERYADDRQKLSQEMMKLYQKEGANPLGGCLPMLLPMPIFIALYWVLWESVELRHAPFMLWIEDLAAMDQYFILPLLMGALMYVQQQLSPAMGDPMQQRMMKIMPIMFTVLFLFFPAGLVLYWLVNSALSVLQQWFVMRQVEKQSA